MPSIFYCNLLSPSSRWENVSFHDYHLWGKGKNEIQLHPCHVLMKVGRLCVIVVSLSCGVFNFMPCLSCSGDKCVFMRVIFFLGLSLKLMKKLFPYTGTSFPRCFVEKNVNTKKTLHASSCQRGTSTLCVESCALYFKLLLYCRFCSFQMQYDVKCCDLFALLLKHSCVWSDLVRCIFLHLFLL